MRRRVGLLGGLFGVLLGALLLVPPSAERLPPLTVYSADPGGAKAFRLWLDGIGYATSTLEGGDYRVPDGARTVLLLAPSLPVTTFEADTLERWVRGGGRLVVVTGGRAADSLLGRVGLAVGALPSAVETGRPLQGGALDPAIRDVEVRAESRLEITSEAAVSILGDGERIFAARVRVGDGELLALSAPHALGNEALRREDNARLALALVGPAGRGAVIFDEVHHGYGATRSRPLFTLLLDYAWGRAALLAGVVVFAYLLLGGRRFGRPRPVIVTRGRSLGEYVVSLGGLYRAGGKRAFAAAHFERRLRREIAQGVGLPSDATDEQIVERARTLGRDPSEALAVVRRLGDPATPRDADVLALVRAGERARAALARR